MGQVLGGHQHKGNRDQLRWAHSELKAVAAWLLVSDYLRRRLVDVTACCTTHL